MTSVSYRLTVRNPLVPSLVSYIVDVPLEVEIYIVLLTRTLVCHAVIVRAVTDDFIKVPGEPKQDKK